MQIRARRLSASAKCARRHRAQLAGTWVLLLNHLVVFSCSTITGLVVHFEFLRLHASVDGGVGGGGWQSATYAVFRISARARALLMDDSGQKFLHNPNASLTCPSIPSKEETRLWRSKLLMKSVQVGGRQVTETLASPPLPPTPTRPSVQITANNVFPGGGGGGRGEYAESSPLHAHKKPASGGGEGRGVAVWTVPQIQFTSYSTHADTHTSARTHTHTRTHML